MVEEETGTGKKKQTSSRIYLTIPEWLTIKKRYLAGEKISHLARDYKITRSTVNTRAKREGWVHGSEKVALEEKIGEAVVDSYKASVKEAHVSHLARIKNSSIVNQKITAVINFLIDGKLKRLKEYEEAKVETPDDFSIMDEERIFTASRRDLIDLIRLEREVLGIVDKPYLAEDSTEKGIDEMSKVSAAGIESLKEMDAAERKALIAEMTDKAIGGEQGSHSLQS